MAVSKRLRERGIERGTDRQRDRQTEESCNVYPRQERFLIHVHEGYFQETWRGNIMLLGYFPSSLKNGNVTPIHKKDDKRKVKEKSKECHNHKLQPFQDTKRKRNPTNPNKHKSNKRTKSTKISSLPQAR